MSIEISVSQELKKNFKLDDNILLQYNGCSKIIEAFQTSLSFEFDHFKYLYLLKSLEFKDQY